MPVRQPSEQRKDEKKSYILIRLVEHQPAAGRPGFADDLAIFSTPIRLTKSAPPGQRGSLESGFRKEYGRRCRVSKASPNNHHSPQEDGAFLRHGYFLSKYLYD
jgi:hypothetical protein